jgi:hypothetical protein
MPKGRAGGLTTLLLIPSFYGAIAWAAWLTLYQARLIAWDPSPALADTLYVLVLAFYVVSTVLWYSKYREWHDRNDAELLLAMPQRHAARGVHAYLGLLHALGFLGWAIYIRDFATALGGLRTFGELLLGASWVIRRQAEVTLSTGLQLSYFGWIAIALTCFEFRRGRIGRLWLAVAAAQFAANFLYIARTGPVTILFTSALLALVAVPIGRMKLVALRAIALSVVLGVLFLLIATWIGKVAVEGQYRATVLPLWAQNLYYYGTSGFAYFGHLVGAQEPIAYAPERALYPALKALSALGVLGAPPSQINEYFSVPFSTNVGTFLEPFYRDGGLAFAFVAIVVHSLGLDMLGLVLLRSGRRFALFAWANLCFVTFISFFTPKITGFPTWLFTGLAIAAMLWMEKYPGLWSGRSVLTLPTGGQDAAH